ncbi:MAG: 4-phosphoerythronate dehydrogenase [Bacteroidota bacterium]
MPPRPLRLLADANIPFLHKAFDRYGSVEVRPGAEILPGTLSETDILLVRSVTPVNEALLAGTPVRFVGTATAGTDHIDTNWLASQGIAFASAPGSNAQSVVEYVLAALFYMQGGPAGWAFRGKTVGVVGCGQVGGRLRKRLPHLGFRVLACDPPLSEAAEARGEPHDFVSLQTVLDEADIITLHTPLTRDGPHPTHHLIGLRELIRLERRGVDRNVLLINAARGAVVDNKALRDVLRDGILAGAILDVWENEPTPDPELVRLALVATPHIAGYAYDGKVAGTTMLVDALDAWLQAHPQEAGRIPARIPAKWDAEDVLGSDGQRLLEGPFWGGPDGNLSDGIVGYLLRRVYDLSADDARFRKLLDLPSTEHAAYFRDLRKTYPKRRHFDRFTVDHHLPDYLSDAVTKGLGLQIEQR